MGVVDGKYRSQRTDFGGWRYTNPMYCGRERVGSDEKAFSAGARCCPVVLKAKVAYYNWFNSFAPRSFAPATLTHPTLSVFGCAEIGQLFNLAIAISTRKTQRRKKTQTEPQPFSLSIPSSDPCCLSKLRTNTVVDVSKRIPGYLRCLTEAWPPTWTAKSTSTPSRCCPEPTQRLGHDGRLALDLTPRRPLQLVYASEARNFASFDLSG
jgi:hypothetical protein